METPPLYDQTLTAVAAGRTAAVTQLRPMKNTCLDLKYVCFGGRGD